eukprot:176382_1
MFSRRLLTRFFKRSMSTQTPKTAIVMLNMGGPKTITEVEPFLYRLFEDKDIMQLENEFVRKALAQFIVRRRLTKVQQHYKEIDCSPIRKWTNIQGEAMAKLLDERHPESAPHKHYIAFRYANPLTQHALEQMKNDGVTRAIAFTQYPQYSCTTTGSSLNHLWESVRSMGMEGTFQWSVIDRWPLNAKFIEAVCQNVDVELKKFSEPNEAVIVFSAHSLPMKTVYRGDPYVHEVNLTVAACMERLREMGHKNTYILAWQSQVGPLPWMGPQTGDVLKGLPKQGRTSVLVAPIAFTSDHIETLHEIDIEYAEDAKKAGIKEFSRSASLNDSPVLFDALADIVVDHLKAGKNYSDEYKLKCADCFSPDRCRQIVNPAFKRR